MSEQGETWKEYMERMQERYSNPAAPDCFCIRSIAGPHFVGCPHYDAQVAALQEETNDENSRPDR